MFFLAEPYIPSIGGRLHVIPFLAMNQTIVFSKLGAYQFDMPPTCFVVWSGPLLFCTVKDILLQALQLLHQDLILFRLAHRDAEAVAAELHRVAVADDDALADQMLVRLIRVLHLHQDEVGVCRVYLLDDRQLREGFLHQRALVQ